MAFVREQDVLLSVVTVGGDGDAVRALDGSVEVVEVAVREGVGLCALRAEGIRLARGRRVAVLGERYTVGVEWQRAAAGSEWDVATGAVRPGRLGYFGWAVYLSEYAKLAPPVVEGPLEDFRLLAGGNVVYRAGVFDADELAACLTELQFHEGLKSKGVRAGRLTGLEAEYAEAPAVGEYIRERFCFSEQIARERGQRWRALLAPALPLLVLVRTGREALRRPGLRWQWVVSSPAILTLGLVQAAGEMWGCVGYPDGFGGKA